MTVNRSVTEAAYIQLGSSIVFCLSEKFCVRAVNESAFWLHMAGESEKLKLAAELLELDTVSRRRAKGRSRTLPRLGSLLFSVATELLGPTRCCCQPSTCAINRRPRSCWIGPKQTSTWSTTTSGDPTAFRITCCSGSGHVT